ncbi:beta-ketoacyl-[acyl-carrier-protein] synthase family protein [Phytomonospora endophytica]|uniref:3-oxoacyl-[acyl-carrier-protein] synthase II n=1 Tax=Phytomonospora endophytica TaxID=714109 RepID=A0A841FV78_9ACTN|nr:beta-ketoacyl-[acyl-carrier-protein] synthase family protein [Phytomonospora endophytica]MBB6038673.1 3-oxoacyl-[acyl-carrier-protein] synthase II [Phytomonospora endophytica]GIG69182.1 3-oxoacyl-ACP synthase [Phytomonospora endophytica]
MKDIDVGGSTEIEPEKGGSAKETGNSPYSPEGTRPGCPSGTGSDAQRVLITGIGLIMPGATSATDFWRHLADGRSQMTRVPRLVDAGLPTQTAAVVDGFDYRCHLPDLRESYAAKYSREQLIVIASVANALQDAGVVDGDIDPQRIGVVGSSSRGPVQWWDETLGMGQSPGPQAALKSLPGSPTSLAAIHCGLQGPVVTLSNACVGGSQAIGMALDKLRSGEVDAMLAGGYEFPVTRSVVESFLALGDGVLCRATDPDDTMRPYDKRRRGFQFGEGSLWMFLETAESARRRGAVAYAEITAQRSGCEAGHPTTMDLTGAHGAALVNRTLADAGIEAADVGYMCGHGTATRYNDATECRIVDRVFGTEPGTRPALGSVKPVYGHSFGLSAAVNVAATALMLHRQVLTPTVGCVQVDPECAGDHVQGGARPQAFQHALSLAFALGSQTAVVALSRAPEAMRRPLSMAGELACG